VAAQVVALAASADAALAALAPAPSRLSVRAKVARRTHAALAPVLPCWPWRGRAPWREMGSQGLQCYVRPFSAACAIASQAFRRSEHAALAAGGAPVASARAPWR
jgi:hypothetical protein